MTPDQLAVLNFVAGNRGQCPPVHLLPIAELLRRFHLIHPRGNGYIIDDEGIEAIVRCGTCQREQWLSK